LCASRCRHFGQREPFEQPDDLVFKHACQLGLEGIVSKRLGSRYRSGRSRDWLKFKNPNAVKREVNRSASNVGHW
jgi:ATP-dependent DNA ligase